MVLQSTVEVRSVWNHNLEEEFAIIRQLSAYYPYVALDTEFPGVVYEAPMNPRYLSPDQRYALIKKNVDCLKLIQLGLTLSTSVRGNGIYVTWEFNFRGFNKLQDRHAPSSIQLLESQGLDLWKNYYHGIDPRRFADLLRSSGLLNNQLPKIWIGFHMAYDVAYLIKVLTGEELPDSMEEFLKLVRGCFGFNIYDIKHLCKTCNLYGGLERVAGSLNVHRKAGFSHHAGSDSLLTWHTFRRMIENFYRGGIEARQAGVMFGIQDS